MRLKKNEIKLQQLKGRTKILDLFENGKVYSSKKILIRLKKEEKLPFLAVAVAVSKKNFIRAVDRNYIKRQMRVALKRIEEDICFSGACFVLYTGVDLPKSNTLPSLMKELFKKVGD